MCDIEIRHGLEVSFVNAEPDLNPSLAIIILEMIF